MAMAPGSGADAAHLHETLLSDAIDIVWRGEAGSPERLLDRLIAHPAIAYVALDLPDTVLCATRHLERRRDAAHIASSPPLAESAPITAQPDGTAADARGAPPLIIVRAGDTEFPPALTASGYRCMVEVPLADAVRVRGRLTVASPDDGLLDASLARFLRTMARLLTIALARLEDEAVLLRLDRAPLVLASAAEVAHDLKNVLMALAGLLHLLQRDLPADHTARQRADLVQAVLADVTELARRTVLLTRPAPITLEPIDLAYIAAEVARLSIGWTGPRHSVRVEAGPDAPAVVGDALLLRQAVGQLLQNALQAMPDGGTATLRVRRGGPGGEGQVGRGRAGAVSLDVIDAGVGIPPEEVDRIFEPFVTLRGEEGSGIGLAAVRRIVGVLGGTLTVVSAPGAGSTFTITLMAVDTEPERHRA